MSEWMRSTDPASRAIKTAEAMRLLAEAVRRHPDEPWARRALERFPGLTTWYGPPTQPVSED